MIVQSIIEKKIADSFAALHLEVINESSNHNVPVGSESHFKIVIVCDEFEGEPLIHRHRAINKVLEHELAEQIHALALHTYTKQEWVTKNGQAPLSPPCLGGSK